MLKFVWLTIFVISSSANAACKGILYKESRDVFSSRHPVEEGITIGNTLRLPKLIDEKEIIVDKGPVVIMQSGDSYISYRVIDNNEVEFIGSKKSPYNFFKSAFTKPEDITECSFIDGIRGMENRSYYDINNIEFYVHEMKESITIYLLSTEIDIVLEVTTKNIPREVVNSIMANTKVK